MKTHLDKEGIIKKIHKMATSPDPNSMKVSYEILFTSYFNKLKPTRALEKRRIDIVTVEKDIDGLLPIISMKKECA